MYLKQIHIRCMYSVYIDMHSLFYLNFNTISDVKCDCRHDCISFIVMRLVSCLLMRLVASIMIPADRWISVRDWDQKTIIILY